jgi:hypothetical protein
MSQPVQLAEQIARAGADGRAVVLCYPEGTCQILDVRAHTVGTTG